MDVVWDTSLYTTMYVDPYLNPSSPRKSRKIVFFNIDRVICGDSHPRTAKD